MFLWWIPLISSTWGDLGPGTVKWHSWWVTEWANPIYEKWCSLQKRHSLSRGTVSSPDPFKASCLMGWLCSVHEESEEASLYVKQTLVLCVYCENWLKRLPERQGHRETQGYSSLKSYMLFLFPGLLALPGSIASSKLPISFLTMPLMSALLGQSLLCNLNVWFLILCPWEEGAFSSHSQRASALPWPACRVRLGLFGDKLKGVAFTVRQPQNRCQFIQSSRYQCMHCSEIAR